MKPVAMTRPSGQTSQLSRACSKSRVSPNYWLSTVLWRVFSKCFK